jgi:hypothetical protein
LEAIVPDEFSINVAAAMATARMITKTPAACMEKSCFNPFLIIILYFSVNSLLKYQ